MEIRIEVPLNQVMVLEPFDGDAVKYKKYLKVKIASGYGVLTFISITINGKLAVRMKNAVIALIYGDGGFDKICDPTAIRAISGTLLSFSYDGEGTL